MVDRLFDELGLNKREATEIIAMFFDEVRASLEVNRPVKIYGFGTCLLFNSKQPNATRPSFCLLSESERPHISGRLCRLSAKSRPQVFFGQCRWLLDYFEVGQCPRLIEKCF